MTTEAKEWRAVPAFLTDDNQLYVIADSHGFNLSGVIFNQPGCDWLIERLNALEACAETLREMLPLAEYEDDALRGEGAGYHPDMNDAILDAAEALRALDQLRGAPAGEETRG